MSLKMRSASLTMRRIAGESPYWDASVVTLHPADGFGVGEHTETDWTVERDGVRVRVR